MRPAGKLLPKKRLRQILDIRFRIKTFACRIWVATKQIATICSY